MKESIQRTLHTEYVSHLSLSLNELLLNQTTPTWQVTIATTDNVVIVTVYCHRLLSLYCFYYKELPVISQMKPQHTLEMFYRSFQECLHIIL